MSGKGDALNQSVNAGAGDRSKAVSLVGLPHNGAAVERTILLSDCFSTKFLLRAHIILARPLPVLSRAYLNMVKFVSAFLSGGKIQPRSAVLMSGVCRREDSMFQKGLSLVSRLPVGLP